MSDIRLATEDFIIDTARIYRCTGFEDDLAIQNMVNDFFNNGTAMTMSLKIVGDMGLRETPGSNTHIYINSTNERGAMCHLDFADCNVPETTVGEGRIFFQAGGKVRLYVKGLCVKMVGASGHSTVFQAGYDSRVCLDECKFTAGTWGLGVSGNAETFANNCEFTANSHAVKVSGSNIITISNSVMSGDAGVIILSSFAGMLDISTSKITALGHAVYMQSSNTAVRVNLTRNRIGGSSRDIDHPTANTVKWNIVGNQFSKDNVKVDGGDVTNKLSDYVYMPQYANRFNQTIE